MTTHLDHQLLQITRNYQGKKSTRKIKIRTKMKQNQKAIRELRTKSDLKSVLVTLRLAELFRDVTEVRHGNLTTFADPSMENIHDTSLRQSKPKDSALQVIIFSFNYILDSFFSSNANFSTTLFFSLVNDFTLRSEKSKQNPLLFTRISTIILKQKIQWRYD